MKVKHAMFIQTNCELCQEFYFAHPRTKFKKFRIHNTHFSGSALCNLFGKGAESFEKTSQVAWPGHKYVMDDHGAKSRYSATLSKEKYYDH